MSDEPPRPPNNAMPSIVWAVLGVLLVALFVLILGVLHPVGSMR